MVRDVRRSADVIVVGAGAAGSTVAARVAAAGGTVLLVEAGASANRPEVSEPTQWYRMLKENTAMQWLYTSAPQEQLDGRRIQLPKAWR